MAANWDQKQVFAYGKTGNIDQFELEEGVYALPKAEDPPTDPTALASWSPVSFVKVHAPFRKKIVNFRSRKSGGPPVVTAPKSSGAFQFLNGTLAVHQPQLDSTLGNFKWEVMGQFEYVESCRSSLDDGFVLTGHPFALLPQLSLQNQVQPITVTYGAIAQAGTDARIGYTIASQMTLDSGTYTYTIPTYLPGLFFNDQMLNGETYQLNGFTNAIRSGVQSAGQ